MKVFCEDKRILGQTRKAIEEFNMINAKDSITVGVSGGKDSLVLLYSLARLREFLNISFNITAVVVNLGFDDYNTESTKDFCSLLDVDYVEEKTSIGEIVFNIRKENNPCSLCANLRRGALNKTAIKLNCNKVALGHTRDDIIETFIMSLFYEGRINTFPPVTYLDRKKLYVIRPLIYIEEREITEFIKKNNILVTKNPCPVDKNTSRQYIKDLLKELSLKNKDIKSNIFGSIIRSNLDGFGGVHIQND